jgi:hypothetical protein
MLQFREKLNSNRAVSKTCAVATVAFLIVFGTAIALSQGSTATITGTVTDSQGALVVGAMVTATEVETSGAKSTVADSAGVFTLPGLPVGSYAVEVTKGGFKQFVQRNIVLTVDQTLKLDITLTVGGVDQTIEVTTAPPLVDTTSAEIGRTVEPEEITELPMVNRDVYEEVSLTPGVQSNSGSVLNSNTPNMINGQPPAEDVVVNGSIDSGTPMVSYYLDGVVNMTAQRNYGNQLPSPDAIQEFRVETSNFSPEYGRFSGAVVTAVTRSGTNAFHGSLFEVNRNTDFNATPWGVTLKQPYHRNNFGGTVGGPVKKDKAFFFFSYGGLRQVTGQVLSGGIVPTANEKEGDFTSINTPIYLPGTKTRADGVNASPNCQTATLNCFPTGYLDPTATNIMSKYIPQANQGNTWSGYFTAPLTDNEYLAKYNQVLSSKDSISAEFFSIDDATLNFGGGNFLWSAQSVTSDQKNAIVSEVHTISNSTVNQAWVSFTKAIDQRVLTPAISLNNLGSTFQPQGAPALPVITVTGYFTLSNTTGGSPIGDEFYSVRDVLTSTKGRHSLVYGGEMFLDHIYTVGDIDNYGSFAFSTSGPTTTGNTLADFITGSVASMEQDSPYASLLSTWHYGMFAKDTYKITPRLTLNLGLRYDIDTPPVQSQNLTQTFVPNVQSTVSPSAPEGLLYPGDKGVTRGPVSLKLHHISPRVGIAWDPFGNGKTAIRAGGGVFYGAVSGNQWNQPANALPFAVRQTFQNITSLSNVYANPASFPTGYPFPYVYNPANPRFLPNAGVEAISLGFQWPYTYQINAAVDQQLPGDAHATIAYVGSMSHDIPFTRDANYPVYAPGATTSTASLESRRPYPDNGALGQVQVEESTQTTSYHSLQVSVEKRMSRNFMLNGFYVWSHTFLSADLANTGIGGDIQDFNALWEERGPSPYDQRSMASMSGIWDPNYYTGSSRLMKQLLNGWEISSIVTLDSGMPANIISGGDANENGYTSSNRPNVVPGTSAFLSPHRSRPAAAAEWFNPAAFTPIVFTSGTGNGIGPFGADGNTPHDYLRSPGFRDIDLGLFRTFSFAEGIKFQFRAEATNAFNLVSLAAPNVTLSSPNVGKITSAVANSNRQIQLGGRVTF